MGSLLDQQYEIYGQGGGPPLLLDADFKPQHPRKRRKLSKEPYNALEQLLGIASQNKGKAASPSRLPGGFPPECSFRALAVYSFLRTLSVQLRLSPFTPNVFLRALYLPYPNKLLGEVHVSLLRSLLLNLNLGYGFKQKGAATHYHKRRLIDNLRMPLRGGDNLTYLDGLSWPLFFDDYSHLTADRLWRSVVDTKSYADIRPTESDTLGYPDYEDEQFAKVKETTILHSKTYTLPASSYSPSTASGSMASGASKMSVQSKALESAKSKVHDAGQQSSSSREPVKATIDSGSDQKEAMSPSTQQSRGRRSLPIHKRSGPSSSEAGGPYKTQALQQSNYTYKAEHAVHAGTQLPTSFGYKYPGVHPPHAQSTETSYVPERPLNVEDNVADALRSFVSKIPSRSENSIDQEDMNVSLLQFGNDDELPSGDRHFVHFEPMKAMRSGIPYHRLRLSQKLDILEFLMDELLEVAVVAAEFSMRHGSLYVYPYSYAAWPKKSEFESLNNEDQCGVCGLEGDLLCCDGCSRSYHKECIGMKPTEELPEGEWLCPECQVADPSKFGPLYGGQKASVDWVRVRDVSSRIQADALNQSHDQPLPSNGETIPSITQLDVNTIQQSTLIGNSNQSLPAGPSVALSNIAVQPDTKNHFTAAFGQTLPQQMSANALVGPNQQTLPHTSMGVPNELTAVPTSASTQITQNMQPNSAVFDQFRFLIVHGFVFQRKDSDVPGTAPYTALLEAEVNDCMSRFQLPIAQEWPFRQIPTAENTGSMHFPSFHNYFLSSESFNPSKYVNKYTRALVPFSFKASVGIQDFPLLSKTFESECNSSTARMLTEVMQRDMSLDSHVATCLRRQTKLFNPYELVAGYMLKLDASLRKACLMDSSWESGKIRAVHEVWSENVKKSKSLYRLANLLVKLVDHIHPRAFLEGWNHNSLLKKQESEHMSERNYETLPAEWDKKKECRKRRWETTPSNLLMTLCSREKVKLSSFVKGINPASIQITAVRSHRKKARTSADKHAAKMIEEHLVRMAKAVDTSGAAMHVDRKSPEALPSYVDTSDIIPPQKPYPAYFQFANRRRLEMKEKYPGISSVEISKMLSDIWKNESDEFREKFSIEEMKQRKEYKIAMEEYHKKVKERVAAVQSGAGEKEDAADADEKSNDADDTATKQSNPKSPALDKNTSRRSRRSGRIARTSDHNEPAAAPFTSIASGQAPSNTFSSKSVFESKRKHMIAVEKLLKSATQKETFWPIAGRIPFSTVGDLPPKVMQRLGRNGGAAIAPHVAYNTAHEVGQICNSHIWRKKTGACRTFEDLIYQARRLESFLDRQAMHSFEGTVRRGKSQFLKEVRCSQVDPGTGLLHHFIVNKKSGRGCWMSEDMMDVASSTLEQLRRKTRQVELRRERARVAQMAKKAKILANKALAGQTKVSSTPVQEAFPRGAHDLASLATSRQINVPSRTTANVGTANYEVAARHGQGNRPQPQNGLAGIQMQLQLSLKRHEMDARQLFQTFSMVGMRPTGERGLALRQKNFPTVKASATQLQKYQPDFLCGDAHVIGMMKHVEKIAIGVTLDSFPKGNQVQNSGANDQQGQAIGVHGTNATGLYNLPREGSKGLQLFNSSQSNPMDEFDPTPITNAQLNGRGGKVSSLTGNLQSSCNRQQNPVPIRQGASTGMVARQITPNISMKLGSHGAPANSPPNSTGHDQRGLAPITSRVSAVGQNQGWNGMGNFKHTPQATGISQALLQQSLQQNVGPNSQSHVPQQFSHQMLQQAVNYQKQNLMGQQQNTQAPGQANLAQHIANQRAQSYQKQNLMGQQQNARAAGPANLAQHIANQRAQSYQKQNLMGQQQNAQAPGPANLAQHIANQRAQSYQKHNLMGQQRNAQAPGQANLAQHIANQRAQSYQKHNLMGQQQNTQAQEQANLAQHIANQRAQNYQKQNLMGQQQNAQAPGQANLAQHIANQRAQNYQRQILIGQQQSAQAPGQGNLTHDIASQRAQNYQNQVLMGRQQGVQAPGQVNLTQNIESQRAQYNQSLGTDPQPHSHQGRSALSQQQMQQLQQMQQMRQQLKGWPQQGNFFPPSNGMQ
ncbi:unnamed protein product [Cylindrotheca closterium]|uniref:Uncharacterized protein n=1 Tax=Cylindrotheca closterium TaxID=2856 RepID=A0AAD2CQD4_9STRA|nr:unnamed protein product [Cylindrotheca closterium]